jgi:hypothetical protein
MAMIMDLSSYNFNSAHDHQRLMEDVLRLMGIDPDHKSARTEIGIKLYDQAFSIILDHYGSYLPVPQAVEELICTMWDLCEMEGL